MTIEKLNRILKENNIPKDAVLLSNTGRKCWPTATDGVYYNAEDNIIVLTREYNEYDYYGESPEWVELKLKEELGPTFTFKIHNEEESE